ncbi:virulence RhuM family protein [Selenomonas sp.]|uniref:virulence RhuM family protein n=1 Tax=Selenomonas sp. TaxID=2053611 RepID=UPI002A75F771|nr:RhuM family protein [Selenomonas sp.]MDY3298635.1 RhuM family protein [Selenomonas sp.]
MDDIIIYNTDDGKASVKLYAKDGTVWLPQAQIAVLFETSKQNIGQHLKHCFEEGEIDKNSVVKFFFTTAADGKNYRTAFYSLDAILAVGFRVHSPRGTQFRKWAGSTPS